jgi:hypothetical protein
MWVCYTFQLHFRRSECQQPEFRHQYSSSHPELAGAVQPECVPGKPQSFIIKLALDPEDSFQWLANILYLVVDFLATSSKITCDFNDILDRSDNFEVIAKAVLLN